MNKEELRDLLERFAAGNTTASEKSLLESWYLQQGQTDDDSYSHADKQADAEQIWSKIRVNHTYPLWALWSRRFAAAALILISLSSGIYFYTRHDVKKSKADNLANEIKPGKNNAILILASGKHISLDNLKNGEIAREPGVVITKAADGMLIYTAASVSDSSQAGRYTTVQTPNGGQYQMRLPDGTNIWLNAASSVRFLVVFGQSERRVELQGEAYFEVAKDKSKPFIVTTSGQNVTVLGTHFNISSYPDDSETKTTLLEGSVKVNALGTTKFIQPGEKAVLTKKSFDVHPADIEETMAWKNGFFRFSDEQIADVARKLSRWYNVDFVFDAQPPAEGFNGVISRSKNLSQVLKMLEKTKAIHFQKQGRRIIVKQ